ncbi:hypothetical protein ABD05_29175 [Burkholderia pyrrocinia]|nr:hypothetical protein ABD05_29175 [Burkholderia pyrrocinia]
MQTTLIDELVNFKEGFSPALIAIRRASNGGADELGGGTAAGRVPAAKCRERLMGKRRREASKQRDGETARYRWGSRSQSGGADLTGFAPPKRRH